MIERCHCSVSLSLFAWRLTRPFPAPGAMSTWKNVGMTYLKYADLCATHVRNALKEPAKTKSKKVRSKARLTRLYGLWKGVLGGKVDASVHLSRDEDSGFASRARFGPLVTAHR